MNIHDSLFTGIYRNSLKEKTQNTNIVIEYFDALENDLRQLASLYAKFFDSYRGESDFDEGVSKFKESTKGQDIFTRIVDTTKRVEIDINNITASLDKIEITENSKDKINANFLDLANTVLYIMKLNQSFQNNQVIELKEKQEVNVEYQKLVTKLRELNQAIIDRQDRLGIMSINDALKKAKEIQDSDQFKL